MAYFTETVGLSWVTGFAVIILESIGAILLIGGFSTRIVAMAFTLLGLGILTTVHLQNGFFMNWGGTQSGEGIEFFLLWLAMSASLVISGGGRYSADQLFFRNN